jgi:hypothetical protein
MSTTANILYGRFCAAVTLAVTAVVCTTAGPALADPETCTVESGSLKVTCTPVTYSPAPPAEPKTGVEGFAEKLPDLSFWHVLGVGLIVIGLIAVMGSRDKSSSSRTMRPGTARAGAYRSEQRSERSVGWFGIGGGIIALGYALGGVAGLILGGIVGGLIILSALKTGTVADEAKSGYDAADQAWRHDVEMAKLNAAMHRPNPAEFDPLGLGIAPPPAPPMQLPPEPVMTDDDALRYARMGGHVDLIPGSAAAALVARDGSWHAAETAWIAACKAANLGSNEERSRGRVAPPGRAAPVQDHRSAPQGAGQDPPADPDGFGRVDLTSNRLRPRCSNNERKHIMKKIPIPILSVVATAAIVTTACTTPPVIHDSGPSPSFSSEALHSCDDGTTLPGDVSPTPCPPTSAVSRLEYDRALANRARLEKAGRLGVPPEVDLELVEAATKDRTPYAFSVGDCAWMRTADGALWSLNTAGGALTRDTDREKLFRTAPGARIALGCTMRGVADSIPVGLDSVAADAAKRAGKPYRWHESCRTYVNVSGAKLALPDTITASGEVVSTRGLDFGCSSGVERPGGNGVALPGQTPAPTEGGQR